MTHQGQQLSAQVDDAHEIEQVLLGLADGSYVLSTPDGAVAECGVGVVALLGERAEVLAGRRTADALVPGADAETRAAFEALLHSEAPGAPVFRTATAAGVQRSLQFVVVAVPLALGWEFTSLLAELGSRDAGTWHPEALRLRHGRALEAIEGVCASGAQPDPGARLAGILIVVRDVDAPRLTREDVGRRMAEHRDAARAAAADAARHADAATGRSQGTGEAYEGEGAGLEDLVERARILRERVEEAERDAAAAIAERDHALAQLAAAQAGQAAESERREAGESELSGVAAELRDARGESALLHGQLTATRNELEAAHRELEAARGEELAGIVAERDALRGELATVSHELVNVRAQLQSAGAETETVRAQLAGVHEELESTRAELAGTLAAAEGAQAEREQARIRADQLLSEAESARAAADAIRAEFAFDEPRAPAGSGSAPGDAGAPAGDPALELPAGAPGEAIALIGPNGNFKRLDDAFCSLLGYRETDLRAARWPSVIDRENLAAHQEIARALRAGEIASAPVETVYMHAQGLLVPVAGTVSALRPAGGGTATHLVFRAEVRRTSGP
jgi:PAS domain S-box-containing protein